MSFTSVLSGLCMSAWLGKMQQPSVALWNINKPYYSCACLWEGWDAELLHPKSGLEIQTVVLFFFLFSKFITLIITPLPTECVPMHLLVSHVKVPSFQPALCHHMWLWSWAQLWVSKGPIGLREPTEVFYHCDSSRLLETLWAFIKKRYKGLQLGRHNPRHQHMQGLPSSSAEKGLGC